MIRSFVAPVTLTALAVLLVVGACNRQGPTPKPTDNINTTPLMESLGTASAIPAQQCDEEVFSQPLILASAGAGDDVQIYSLHPVGRTLPVSQMIAGYGQHVECIPRFAQQDNAVPLTRVRVPVEF